MAQLLTPEQAGIYEPDKKWVYVSPKDQGAFFNTPQALDFEHRLIWFNDSNLIRGNPASSPALKWPNGWNLVVAPIPAGVSYTPHNQWWPEWLRSWNETFNPKANSSMAINLGTLPATAPDWAKTIWQGVQSLGTEQTIIGQAATAAAANSQEAAANTDVIKAGSASSSGDNKTLYLGLAAAAVAIFFIWKK